MDELKNDESKNAAPPDDKISAQQNPLELLNPSAPPVVEPLSHAFPPPSRGILFGSDGLRWGWRFALYLALAIVSLVIVGLLARLTSQHHFGGLWPLLLAEAGSLIAVVFPAYLMALTEKRPFGIYGLPAKSAFGADFWRGILWGTGALTLLMVTMRLLGVFYFGEVTLHGLRIVKFAAFWGLFFLIVGFFEEFFMRGYTLFTIAQGVGFWPAAFIMSAIFGALHLGNPHEGWIGALALAIIGLFFCLTLRRTGTLWFAVGFHAAWDWFESYVYSVPDSGTQSAGHLLNSTFRGSKWLTGGTIGPEGSLLVFPLLALLWIAYDRLHPQIKYGERIASSLSPHD